MIGGGPQAGSGSGKSRVVGPYTLLRELGRGARGVVYLAQRAGSEDRYALKVLMGDAHQDPAAVARFRLETAIAIKLDHPGIVRVVDYGMHGQHPYLVMEHCAGETLRDRLRRGALTVERAVRLVTTLSAAMAHAHSLGVVHRDLKPANVILEEPYGRPRVTDFGLAQDRALAGRLTRTGEALGTPFYMAPEQFRADRDADHRVDVYALGVILYELLAGRVPFLAETTVEVAELAQQGRPPPLRKFCDQTTPELEAIVATAMAHDPQDRYASAGHLARELVGFLQQVYPDSAEGLEVPEEPSERRSGLLLAVLATSLLAIALTVVAGALVVRRTRQAEARALIEQARGQSGDDALRLLEEAAPLAAGDPDLTAEIESAREGVERAERRARVDALLERARAAGPAFASSFLAEAQVVAAGDAELLETIEAARAQAAEAQGQAAVQDALDEASVRSRAARPWEDVAARLGTAREHAGDDRDLTAEVSLAHATLALQRGRFDDGLTALTSHPGLLRRKDALGLRARFYRAVLLRSVDRHTDSTQALEKLVEEDPTGADGLAAAAYLELFVHKRGDQAERRARDALGVDPEHVEAQLTLTMALLLQQRLDEAWTAAERAEDLSPGHPSVHAAKGLIDRQRHRFPEALASFDEAIRLTEPHPAASTLRSRAELAMKVAQPDRAISDLDRLLEKEPQPYLLLLRGLAYDQRRDPRSAMEDFRQARELDPDRFQTLLARFGHGVRNRIQAYLRGAPPLPGLVEPAAPPGECPRYVERPPLDPATPAGAALARALTLDRQLAPYADVIAAIEEAEGLSQGQPDAYATVQAERMDVYFRRGRLEEAVAEADERAKVGGKAALHIRSVKGMSLIFLDDRAGGRQILERVYADDPDGAIGLAAGAVHLAWTNQREAALRAGRRAIELDPSYEDGFITLAFLLNEASNAGVSAQLLGSVLQRWPHHPRALFAMHLNLLVSRDVPRAMQALDRAIAAMEPKPSIWLLWQRGRLLLQSRRHPQSVADFDRVLARQPAHDMALRFRGMAHLGLGDRERAKADLLEARRVAPQSFDHFLRNLRPPQTVEAIRRLLAE